MQYHCERCGKPFEASPAAKRRFCSRDCWCKSLVKKVKRTCEACGKPFLAKRDKVQSGSGRFCSRECANTGWDEPCEVCGTLVHRTPSHAKRFEHIFCSRECYSEWCNQQITRVCEHCGSEFSDKPSKMNDGRGKYCSQACYDAVRAVEMIELTCQQCGKTFELARSHVNDNMYHGKYCSVACQAIARRLPDSARSVYNHEFTPELKRKIRKRDNYTCQLCGLRRPRDGKRLAVHHINYDKTQNCPSNLITLCHSCHSKTNYRRDYWRAYFQRVMVKYYPDTL